MKQDGCPPFLEQMWLVLIRSFIFISFVHKPLGAVGSPVGCAGARLCGGWGRTQQVPVSLPRKRQLIQQLVPGAFSQVS